VGSDVIRGSTDVRKQIVGIIVCIIKRTIIFHRSTKEGLNRWKQSNKIIVINLLDSSLENVAFDVLRGSCNIRKGQTMEISCSINRTLDQSKGLPP
jgi:hypothetical protein